MSLKKKKTEYLLTFKLPIQTFYQLFLHQVDWGVTNLAVCEEETSGPYPACWGGWPSRCLVLCDVSASPPHLTLDDSWPPLRAPYWSVPMKVTTGPNWTSGRGEG